MNVTITGTQKVVIEGFDWGPAVVKTIITLDQPVTADSVNADTFAVTENKEAFNIAALLDPTAGMDPTVHILQTTDCVVAAAYTCDEQGNEISVVSNHIALELDKNPDGSIGGSPYCADFVTWTNTVCDPYELTITLKDGSQLMTESGSPVSELAIDATIDLHTAAIPQLAQVDLTGTFSSSDGYDLTYSSFAPAADGEQHPLVIWLHGAGEGGTDTSIPNMGAKVTALYGTEFQTIMGGAYVLVPQTTTFWLTYNENGDWLDNPGVPSIYTQALMELIESYVAANPDIDANRIYIGGCSNGGYMTMNMVMTYPDYFAAAYPICEAYADAGITDDQLADIKDLPIWFVYAQNDDTVVPANYEEPTIARLQTLGADVHYSAFTDVHDTTGLYTMEDGSPYQYVGHASWQYFFNNQCVENDTTLWDWLAAQSK